MANGTSLSLFLCLWWRELGATQLRTSYFSTIRAYSKLMVSTLSCKVDTDCIIRASEMAATRLTNELVLLCAAKIITVDL